MGTVEFIQIEPTTRCNFTCSFCCGRQMKQGDISFENFKKILSSFKNLQYIELEGEGEGLLHPRFFQMAKYAKTCGLTLSLTTNGSLLNKKVATEIIDAGFETIHCSLESTNPDTFKRLRGGSLEKVVSGTKMLLFERNRLGLSYPAVGFAVTVSKETVDDIPGIESLYLELGLDGGIFFQPLQGMDSYIKYYNAHTIDQVLSEEEQKDLEKWYARDKNLNVIHQQRRPVSTFYEKLFDEFNPTLHGCPWLKKALYFTFEGYAMPCSMVKDVNKYAFGRIGKDSARKILQNRKKMREVLLGGTVPEACSGCHIANRAAFEYSLKHLQSLY